MLRLNSCLPIIHQLKNIISIFSWLIIKFHIQTNYNIQVIKAWLCSMLVMVIIEIIISDDNTLVLCLTE